MATEGAQLADWLATAAAEKASTVTALAPAGVEDVIEIGCGPGALLTELDRRGFAERYWACEPAENLFHQIPTARLARLQEAQQTTFDKAFDGRRFDLAILSHVLEHLVSPAVLLGQALARADYVIVELPIEANVAGRLRREIKGRLQGDQPHAAGHVQFFSRADARRLAAYAGGEVRDERTYFPVAPYAAQARTTYHRLVLAANRLGVAHLYYCHFGMLLTRRSIEAWDHHYAKPV
ncbi:methyltransferase domain-containing protein [Patulibacter sp. S7RM1-6]